jgi:phage shock protein PspC (stress-responsive transcriptional regulator)
MTEHAMYKELRRSRSDRMIAGVCGGLGDYFDINPVFYRVGFVVLTFLGGAGILIYAACALVIPQEGETESIASDVLRNHRKRPVALIGLILAAVAGIALLSHISIRYHSDTFWVIVLIAGGLLIWSQRRDRPAPPPSAATGEAAMPPAAPPAPRRRRRGFLAITLTVVGVLILAAAIACVVVAVTFARLAHGVGDRNFAPATTSALRHDYQVGVGSLDLDLSRLSLPPGTTRIHVEAGIGHVRITVPRGVTVHARTHVTWGEANLLGHEESGHNVRADVGSEHGDLELDTRVGIGQIEVERAVR